MTAKWHTKQQHYIKVVYLTVCPIHSIHETKAKFGLGDPLLMQWQKTFWPQGLAWWER